MSDLVERLRQDAAEWVDTVVEGPYSGPVDKTESLSWEAADEIDQLRAFVRLVADMREAQGNIETRVFYGSNPGVRGDRSARCRDSELAVDAALEGLKG